MMPENAQNLADDDIRLTESPLEGSASNSGLYGAVLHFSGIVRGTEGPRVIQGIRYTAYEEMATKQLQAIVAAARTAAGVDYPVRLIHRLGFVPVGVASVILEVSAPHSREAFNLCQDLLYRLKAEVPIWKEFVE